MLMNKLRLRRGLLWKDRHPEISKTVLTALFILLYGLAIVAIFTWTSGVMNTQVKQAVHVGNRHYEAELRQARYDANRAAMKLYRVESEWRKFLNGAPAVIEPDEQDKQNKEFKAVLCVKTKEITL